jgi:hypothetical protein
LLHEGEYSKDCEVVGEFFVAGDEESFEGTASIYIKWDWIVLVRIIVIDD